ncbi:chaperone modulator CbpM [uncultured Desulfosarcina sp.]|uniref:chaperone modulator CbpM n=1 Tax=uncultured Desulfosarcina sp. TaxID=218289 RepID=UPI0029C79961|nr:chaperone modulator CbpM [uncultured Desulfosarcina sp.]
MTESMIEIHLDSRQSFYNVSMTAMAARVSTSFVNECERENLIQAKVVEGRKGYDHSMVRRLIRIRHFHEDLGFDLQAIDFILCLHTRLIDLQNRLDEMEAQMREREIELLDKIRTLKERLAQDSKWQNR